MTLYFVGEKTAECKIIKEGRKWIYFTAGSYNCKYRVNKISGDVQIGPYWNTEKKMSVEF